MIKAAIFDVDGTLVDTNDFHASAWKMAFAHFGKEVPFAAIREQVGKGSDQLLPVFFSQEELRRFGKEMEEFRAELFKREYQPQARPFPDVRLLFERIKQDGKRIALATSAKDYELQGYTKML